MDNRTRALVVTTATALLCGCPGLFLCLFGGIAATGAPVATEWMGATRTAPMGSTTGLALLCAGLIFLAIPVIVGVVTLRRRPESPDASGPLPPAA
jgi:hypothetical protein